MQMRPQLISWFSVYFSLTPRVATFLEMDSILRDARDARDAGRGSLRWDMGQKRIDKLIDL